MQVEGDRPTLSILRYMGDSKSGRTKDDVFAEFAGKPFFETRLEELINDSAAVIKDDEIILNPKSGMIKMQLVINGYRKFLGLKDTRG